jgi:hypothetical protein
MAEETILEKAGKAVGFGMAMAEDLAGTVKTAVGTAVTTVTDVLSKAPAKRLRLRKLPTNHLQRKRRRKLWRKSQLRMRLRKRS